MAALMSSNQTTSVEEEEEPLAPMARALVVMSIGLILFTTTMCTYVELKLVCQCCRARAMTKLFTTRQLGRIRSWADSSRRAVAAAEEQEQDPTVAWPTAAQMQRAKQAPVSADAHSEEVLAPETVGPPRPPPPRTDNAAGNGKKSEKGVVAEQQEASGHGDSELKELHRSLDKALELISTVPASVTALDSSLVQALEAENARRQQKQELRKNLGL